MLSIAVQLSSSLTSLNVTKQVNLWIILNKIITIFYDYRVVI